MSRQKTTGDIEPSSRADTPALEPGQCDQVAKAASAGLMAHRQVDSAVVEISGPSGSLAFSLRCTLLPGDEPSSVLEDISDGLLSHIETILGQEFVSRDLNFTVAAHA